MISFASAPRQVDPDDAEAIAGLPEWLRKRRTVTADEALAAFRRDALAQRGVSLPPEIIADGEIHRCDTTGRNGDGDGAYLLHLDDGIPAGGFQNHQDGQGWQNWHADIGRALTSAENAELRRKVHADKMKRKAERDRVAAETREKAEAIWEKATPDPDHPYLDRKRIAPHGARQQYHSNNLVVPMRDVDGTLQNLQLIDSVGEKRFLSGGIKKGCSFTIGEPVDGGVVLIAEGFATGASLHQASGYPAVVAFDAGNLLAIAQAARARWPGATIALCADDDWHTEGNPGVTKATEAAAAVGGAVVVPDFGPNRPEKATDFNDVAALWGEAEVKRQVEAGLAAGAQEGGADGEIISPEQGKTPLADPVMAASLVTVGATQAEIERAICRVLLANFGEIDRGRALDAICKSAKVTKRDFNETVKRLRRENRPSLIAAAPKPWVSQLYFKGEEPDPHPTMANACIAFREADAWRDVLWQNEFSGLVQVRRCPPYEDTPGAPCDRIWTDVDEAATTEWMQTYGGIPTIEGWRIFTAVQRIANERKFHPVRDYLDALHFDPRELAEIHFDDWLTYYCGVADTAYHRAVGACFLIGAVARIRRPGCKMDTCLILEGPQGLKKSTVFKTLASEVWFTDASEEVGSKDAALQRRGKWFWEHAELDNLTRGDVSRIKADMSRSVDRFRPPYGRNMVEEPRQSVHCGTVNDSQYLRDATGARRFWPAACGKSIDIEALAADRDKLFAIADARLRLKAQWYLDDPELVKLAEAEQDARYEEDAWQPLIVAWIEANARQSVTVADVLADALGIGDRGRWPRADQMRVATCLKRLGWVRKHIRISSDKWQWRYARPDVTDL